MNFIHTSNTMKNLSMKALATVALAVFILPFSASAVASSAPAVTGSDTGGADASVTSSSSAAPTVTGGNTGGADTNTTSSSATAPTATGSATGGADTNTTSSSASAPTVTGGNTGGADSSPAASNTGGITGGGGSGVTGGGSSGSVSSGGSPLIAVAPAASAAATTSTSSCPLITTFMSIGASNDASEVAKLQAFLKDAEHLNVSVTGSYDQQTADAVKAFQAKYLSDVMGPWDATRPSGIVYITTKKKINQLACAAPLALNAQELAIIDAYKAAQAQASTTGSQVGSTGSDQGTSTNPIIGQNGNGSSNTAAAANASIFDRLWDFIKGLF